MKSQPSTKSLSFSIQDGTSIQAGNFTKNNLHMTPDLSQALREDREEIQKEIALRRKKLIVKNLPTSGVHGGSKRNEQRRLVVESSGNRTENHEILNDFPARHQQKMECETLQFESILDGISKEDFVSGLANQAALLDLSVLYSRVIKGQ